MKILEVLTYYRPWVSGLTIYVERLSRTLAAQGHDVTVLTSQYDPDLPQYDVIDGVKIVRIPVAARVSKGVLMPGFGPMAWKLARETDVIHLHLPQFDAPGVAMRARNPCVEALRRALGWYVRFTCQFLVHIFSLFEPLE